MKNKTMTAIAVLLVILMVALCAALAVGGRLLLIRLTLWLPLPDWLRMILWGWA